METPHSSTTSLPISFATCTGFRIYIYHTISIARSPSLILTLVWETNASLLIQDAFITRRPFVYLRLVPPNFTVLAVKNLCKLANCEPVTVHYSTFPCKTKAVMPHSEKQVFDPPSICYPRPTQLGYSMTSS